MSPDASSATALETGAGPREEGDSARVEAVATALRARGGTVRERELAAALSRLEARGDLPPAQQAAVAAMARRIVAGVLADPVTAVREAEGDAVARTVADLFDLDT